MSKTTGNIINQLTYSITGVFLIGVSVVIIVSLVIMI